MIREEVKKILNKFFEEIDSVSCGSASISLPKYNIQIQKYNLFFEKSNTTTLMVGNTCINLNDEESFEVSFCFDMVKNIKESVELGVASKFDESTVTTSEKIKIGDIVLIFNSDIKRNMMFRIIGEDANDFWPYKIESVDKNEKTPDRGECKKISESMVVQKLCFNNIGEASVLRYIP